MRPSNNTNDYLIIEDYITFNAKMCKCKKYFRSFLVTWKILKWNMQNFFSSVMWKLLKQNTICYLSNISKNFTVPGWIWTRVLSHWNLTLYQLSYQGLITPRVEIEVEIRILAQDGKWTRITYHCHRGAGRAISIVKIHQKSLKYKHF